MYMRVGVVMVMVMALVGYGCARASDDAVHENGSGDVHASASGVDEANSER